MYTIDIENALRAGKTIETIMAEMHDAVASAAANIKAEKDGIKQCREDFMVAMIAYLGAINVLNVDEVSEEDTEKLEDMLIQMESELGKITALIDAVAADTKSNEDKGDDIDYDNIVVCYGDCGVCPDDTCGFRGEEHEAPEDSEDSFLSAILKKLV